MNMRILAVLLAMPVLGTQAAAVLTTLHSFTGGNDGGSPLAGLVQGTDGDFYGTTGYGGVTNWGGTVFKISTKGALTRLHAFTTGNDGGLPAAGLVQGSDGNLFGTTELGGTSNCGTVFKITTNGSLTTLHSFHSYDGLQPKAALVQGSDGNFYGTASGSVFEMTPDGVLTTLVSGFGMSALVQGSDGYFYGTTFGGGTNGVGTVFKMSTNGELTTLYNFGTVYTYATVSNFSDTEATDNVYEPLDGAYPAAGLVQGSDGYFYGTTEWGGSAYWIAGGATHIFSGGTVFRISTNGAVTTLHSFGTVTDAMGNPLDGANPQAGLVQGSDGSFYGTTAYGGNSYDDLGYYDLGYGTIFKISTNGALTTLYSFTSANDGANPVAGLVQGSDGSFYGTTYSGGAGGAGTVFRLTIMPELQAVTVAHGKLSLAWSAEAEARYQLQYTSDLSSSNWINLTNTVTATGATLSTTDIVTNEAQRFYRLALVP